jgi:hypothetical protein
MELIGRGEGGRLVLPQTGSILLEMNWLGPSRQQAQHAGMTCRAGMGRVSSSAVTFHLCTLPTFVALAISTRAAGG